MGETSSLRQTWGGGCRCHIQIKEVPLNRKDLISSPSQDQLPGLNIYLSVFQAGDTVNYGSNSHGYREELSELGSESSDQEGAERKNAPNILREIPELSRDMTSLQECPYIWHLKIWKHPLLHLPNSYIKNLFVWEMEFKKCFLLFKYYLIKLSWKNLSFTKSNSHKWQYLKGQTWPSGQPKWHKHLEPVALSLAKTPLDLFCCM